MKRLPSTPVDRRHRAAKDPKRSLAPRVVNPPAIFVAVQGDWPHTTRYAQAKIRVRKGVYQYLVWRDGDKMHEFYLGKKENRTQRTSAPASCGRDRAGEQLGIRLQGKTMKVR